MMTLMMIGTWMCFLETVLQAMKIPSVCPHPRPCQLLAEHSTILRYVENVTVPFPTVCALENNNHGWYSTSDSSSLAHPVLTPHNIKVSTQGQLIVLPLPIQC